MKITILGSGTSQGVPVIACECEVCKSENPRDKRLRCSVLIETEDQNIVIDTGPDFRQQMLRASVSDLDAVLFTHEHKDHVAGLDDIRAFNFKSGGKAMSVYATDQVQKALKREFAYVFADSKYPGVPEVKLHTIMNKDFEVNGLMIHPIQLMHYKMPVLGFRVGDFTYITDANFIAEEEKEKIKGTKVLVLNALRQSKHISHFNLEEALELIKELDVEKAYLTHISHLMGKHDDVSELLPDNVELAYDGLELEF
ncbi:MAG: MBL fold metallo-hydrolase [Flavobacteriales bacterium]|nr:MBL fold metallo-hydrolase [Flavobacteriales bacterium]|tara:strand:- start:281 stop:1045 length:765 start_codon:yes stop_codon:yes gene_type:complete